MTELIIRSTLPADLEVSLEPLLPLAKSSKLNGMIFVLDKSRTGSCKSLTKEQLSTFITHHGGAVVAMFAPESLGGNDQVTHAFSEMEKAPLAKSAAMAGIPCIDSCQLAGLIDPDYLQREVSRHEAEAKEARAKEEREAEEAMKKKKMLQEQQLQAATKKPRIKRTYSAPVGEEEEDVDGKKMKKREEMGAASHSMSDLPTVKVEQEDEEEEVGSASSSGKRKRDEGGDGMVLAAVKKVARVAKRRKKLETQTTSKPAPVDNEAIMKKKRKVEAIEEVDGENGDSSSNGNGEVPATPLHERRRRFEGKVFFLLGRFMRKQAEMQAFIEENGGEVAKSITRKVTHLLTAQGDDGTLAFKQARQRSLKIITEERLNQFMAEARGARAQAITSSTSDEQGRLLQVPTTPVASSAQRREQAQRVALTPLPSSAQTQPAELLFEASPSWKVIRHKVKKSKKEKKEKKENKEKKEKKSKKKSSSCREEDKENSSPVRLRLDSSP